MSKTARTNAIMFSLLSKMDEEIAIQITKNTIKNIKNTQYNNLESKFIDLLTQRAGKDYYIIPTIDPNEQSIGIISPNLKAIMYVATNTTRKDLLEIYNTPVVLELLHIHSFEKGSGKILMEIYVELQKALNISGSLWTESIENVRYFQNYGFENLGSLGFNKEFLMKLPIK